MESFDVRRISSWQSHNLQPLNTYIASEGGIQAEILDRSYSSSQSQRVHYSEVNVFSGHFSRDGSTTVVSAYLTHCSLQPQAVLLAQAKTRLYKSQPHVCVNGQIHAKWRDCSHHSSWRSTSDSFFTADPADGELAP